MDSESIVTTMVGYPQKIDEILKGVMPVDKKLNTTVVMWVPR